MFQNLSRFLCNLPFQNYQNRTNTLCKFWFCLQISPVCSMLVITHFPVPLHHRTSPCCIASGRKAHVQPGTIFLITDSNEPCMCNNCCIFNTNVIFCGCCINCRPHPTVCFELWVEVWVYLPFNIIMFHFASSVFSYFS